MVAQIRFVRPMKTRPTNRKAAFAHADVLSRFGETLCVEMPEEAWRRLEADIARAEPLVESANGGMLPPAEAAHGACEFDEEPERWDGME